MTWKRLTGDREIDPDFYVEEGENAVYVETSYARRVYGWNGRMFPRLSLCVHNGYVKERAAHLMRTPRLDGPSFKLECSYKSEQGQWWHSLDGVPFELMNDAFEMLSDVKTKLSTSGDGH